MAEEPDMRARNTMQLSREAAATGSSAWTRFGGYGVGFGAATYRLEVGDAAESTARIRDIVRWRRGLAKTPAFLPWRIGR